MGDKPIAIDLFAGAGGLTLGFEMAGFSVKAAVELDKHACEAHEINFPNCKVIQKDITNISGSLVLNELNLKSNQIDVIIGGPPCQGFSMAGKRSNDDERNELLNEYARIVLEIMPKYFVMENVKGLLSYKSGKVVHEFLCRMSEAFNIDLPLRVLNAADFGVPQNRERLIIIGSRKNVKRITYPSPTHINPKDIRYRYHPVFGKHSSLDKLDNMLFCPTVADAISDIPNPDLFDELIDGDTIPYDVSNCKYISEFAKIMRGQIKDASDNSTFRPDWNSKLITNVKRTRHEDSIKIEFEGLGEGENHRSRRKKLKSNGLSPTIRAGTKSDKGSYTALRPIHYEQPRVITVREAARLMSFPDWMYFHHTKWHGFRLVGNAVPPLLAKSVALQVLDALKNVEKKMEVITDEKI
ncbi:DNA cytosine methyltransferase [Paenibacillus elgii]|uniref:DNA cytosine methyltransferase n=1 Tax=Paenibacillus elgii TaxID=189691 RepID=UPI002D7AC5C7|nr:DNA cytosine methyltransferase [Paenibacillus elgii]